VAADPVAQLLLEKLGPVLKRSGYEQVEVTLGVQCMCVYVCACVRDRFWLEKARAALGQRGEKSTGGE